MAAVRRGDWQRRAIETVLAEAAAVGLTWPQALVGLVRLSVDVDAMPGDLVRYERTGRPAPPERQRAHAARICATGSTRSPRTATRHGAPGSV